jgi:hypothetical protein
MEIELFMYLLFSYNHLDKMIELEMHFFSSSFNSTSRKPVRCTEIYLI